MEEAYQKKCNTLCELRGVFGGIAKRKIQNVLVSRTSIDDMAEGNDFNRSVNTIKKVMCLNKIEVTKGVRKMQRDVTQQNLQIQIQLDEMERSIRQGMTPGTQTEMRASRDAAGSEN